ncbi:MAG: GDSL-type esterase/lipase family protein [Candidatus Brocadiaceae bacterium]|nr:GDSL-type esterase/lipase family protein [Candidatus Brocadiaceae bacterium]
MGWIKKQKDVSDSDESSWFKRNPKKTIFFVIFIGSLLLIFSAEIFFKYTTVQFKPVIQRYIRLREHPPGTYKVIRPDDRYMQPVDSLIQKEYRIRTDKEGFLEPSKKYENADKTIVFLGGSTTECFWVDEHNRFPYLSGVLLEQMTGLRINSYNSGVGGNDSFHSLDILLNKIIPLRSDVVVMMHNINDLTILLYEKSYWNNNLHRSPIVTVTADNIVENPTVVDVMRTLKNFFIPNLYQKFIDLKVRFGAKKFVDEFAHVRGQKLVIDRIMIKKEFEMNLQTFISICKIRGITPVLMTQQSRLTQSPDLFISKTLAASLKKDFDIEYKEYQEVYELLNQSIREVGIKNGVMVIDLDKEIPHTKEFIYDTFHFNDNGSKLAAEIISKKLLPIVRP